MGCDAETNIMWQELLIYTGVIHAVNYMHVLLSCTKECVTPSLHSTSLAVSAVVPEHAQSVSPEQATIKRCSNT